MSTTSHPLQHKPCLPTGVDKDRAPHVQLHHHELAGTAAPVSYRTIVELIAATTTKKGSNIQADHDEGYYPTGVKISNKELAAVPLTRHEFHGEWNYTVHSSHD